jgi:hypothetical protein
MQQAGGSGLHFRALPRARPEHSPADGGTAMSDPTPAGLRKGFCIFINTLCQGPVPLVSENDRYVVFETELEAQKEIVDNQMTRLQQFLDREREFGDAIKVEEYVVAVTVHPDGTLKDEYGNSYSQFTN